MLKKKWPAFSPGMTLIAGSFPVTASAKPQREIDYDSFPEVAEANGGMVATAHPLATEIGRDVLKKGSNAIDAAVAIQFALNVTEPMMSGIGGGGFMMVHDGATGDTTIVNSRKRAPRGATPDMFLNENGNPVPFSERVMLGTSGGVPDTLKGLEEALDRWVSRLLESLIGPLRSNWPITDLQSIRYLRKRLRIMKKS